jgi:hypothetical protein
MGDSQKRYGTEPVERRNSPHYHPGWTAEYLADERNPMSVGPASHRAARELARDLIAANARITELERELTTERERNPVAMLKLDGDQAALIAAQARIAELERELVAWCELAASNIGADVDDYSSKDYRETLAERVSTLRERSAKLAAAEATIARVRELPARWMRIGNDTCNGFYFECADNLEAALSAKDGD